MGIQVSETSLKDARLFVPEVFQDERGYFKETYSTSKYHEAGLVDDWVQDNVSRSRRNVVRGLHGDRRMAKLVQVLNGHVWDVIADVRPGSPTYGKWEGFDLSAENHHQLYIPAGFVHGFLSLTDDTVFCYKISALYDAKEEFAVNWHDPTLAIRWPLHGDPLISYKDANAPFL
jgi:dTDP-4-dehydrorhamnose 3,5-epimerase